ncbi:FecR family protein [Sphingobacterium spiritivorum]|uniref:FecR family protein n=1 Tax=Sphingobacterium spiritivorum TaxID=258 RepID=UPI003DA68F77
MKNQEAKALLEKYRNNRCSEEELNLLYSWYILHNAAQPDSLSYSDWISLMDMQLTDRSLNSRIISRKRIAVAASLILFLSAGLLYYYSGQQVSIQEDHRTIVQSVGNKATLTLSGGEQISLEDAQQGDLVRKSGIKVTKTADGEVVFAVADVHESKGIAENIISTPRGGQWQVRLADGSHVFLNAASSISFPGSFSGIKKRIVKLKGEAYFEIAKDKEHPFIVKTEKQHIEVLGTHFNVSSYQDDEYTRTTLLEGAVKIHTENPSIEDVLLRPGQGACYSANTLQIANVDVEESVAWKNGEFSFADEDIYGIMRKIARWYDIEVVYVNKTNKATFDGKISVNRPLIKTLHLLKSTGKVDFQIKGRRVIVI